MNLIRCRPTAKLIKESFYALQCGHQIQNAVNVQLHPTSTNTDWFLTQATGWCSCMSMYEIISTLWAFHCQIKERCHWIFSIVPKCSSQNWLQYCTIAYITIELHFTPAKCTKTSFINYLNAAPYSQEHTHARVQTKNRVKAAVTSVATQYLRQSAIKKIAEIQLD